MQSNCEHVGINIYIEEKKILLEYSLSAQRMVFPFITHFEGIPMELGKIVLHIHLRILFGIFFFEESLWVED